MYDKAMLSALKNADNFMLCAHINPDGDAIGSMLAAGGLLQKLGKRVTMVCQDPIPHRQMHLPGVQQVISLEQAQNMRFDAALALDVSTQQRMGAVYALFCRAPLTFQIDHHQDNTRFADYNFVDGQAAATGELVTALWEELGVPLDRQAAEQLYTAISTDTGNFCFNSVRPYTFACMQRLMEAGLDIAQEARRLFLTRSHAHVAALGKALCSMKYFADGRATCMHLSAQDKAECGATDGDLHGMVNYGLELNGVAMTFMADEGPSGWKVSLRALPGYDVSKVAMQFGGGGHVLAAGCVLDGPYEKVEEQLMAAVTAALKA